MSNDKKYKAIKSAALSSYGDPRFVIIDSETGEVEDDAQGYGYKSAQNAYAAWGYKNRTPEKKQKESQVNAWLRKNKHFCDYLEDCAFYALKDGEDITSKDVEKLLDLEQQAGNLNGDVPGTPSEIFRAWSSGRYLKEHRRKKKKKK